MYFRFLAATVAALMAFSSFSPSLANVPSAQDSGSSTKRLTITRTTTPPVIDGVLDDPAWKQAAVLEDLHEVNPVEYAQPSERTVIHVTYDDHALYVAAYLYGDPAKITAHMLRQGGPLFSDDLFVVILDPFNNGRSGYRFETNPNGLREEALYENVSNEQWEWQAIWDAAATITDKGWVAEMAIPFKSISFDPNNNTWGINFRREDSASNESMAWVSRNRATNPGVAGKVTGLENLDQGLGLDVITSVTATQHKNFGTDVDGSQIEPSVDVFYKITPSLTGSLTVNTDFSATEVDDRQINLSRFALFFPEKRDFFLQDSDIFEFGGINQNGRPFFSRRIGLGTNGEIVDIDAGAKLTGRVGRWNIGVLSIRQEASANTDADNATVARISANVLEESRVGFIATEGSPQSLLDNSLTGFDFLYRNSRLPGGRLLTADAWVQQSTTEGVSGDDSAFGLGFDMPNESGFRGRFNYSEIGINFNPGLGFVNRRGVRSASGATHYTFRPTDRYLRTISSGVEIERIELLTGELQSQEVEFEIIDLDAQAGDSLRLEHTFKKEVLQAPFEIHPGIVIATGAYSFEDTRLDLRSAFHRTVSGDLGILTGEFFNGDRVELSGSLDWKPSPHFTTDIDITVNHITLPEGSFTTRVVSLGADIVFTSELSWVNRIQYDNVSEIIGVQSRLQWIPRAGRSAYLVLNHNFQDYDRNNRFDSAASEAAVKFSYTFRF